MNDSTADDIISFSTGYYYLDDTTPYKSHVGATQTGVTTYSEPFAGFVYSLYVDNTYLSGEGRSLHEDGRIFLDHFDSWSTP